MRGLIFLVVGTALIAGIAEAAIPAPSPSTLTPTVYFRGDASTYNPYYPGYSTGGPSLATGGTYNPNEYTAALQLDLAMRHRCGYGAGRTCYAVVQEPRGRAAIVLINDNGPLTSGRIIDLNEKSMNYLSYEQYGRNSGVIRNVTVSLLDGNNHTPGPVNEADRLAWANKLFNTPFDPTQSTGSHPSNLAQLGAMPYQSTAFQQSPVPAQPGSTQPGQYFQNQGGPAGAEQNPLRTNQQQPPVSNRLLTMLQSTAGASSTKSGSTFGDNIYGAITLAVGRLSPGDPLSTTTIVITPIGTETFVVTGTAQFAPSPGFGNAISEIMTGIKDILNRMLSLLPKWSTSR